MQNVLPLLADYFVPDPVSTTIERVFGAFGFVLLLWFWTFGIALAFAIYWAPSMVALAKKHPHLVGIIVINFLFGWTFIGWIASFIWAFIVPQPTQVIIQQIPPAPNALPLASVPVNPEPRDTPKKD